MSLYNPDQAARDTWAGQSADAFRVRRLCYAVCFGDSDLNDWTCLWSETLFWMAPIVSSLYRSCPSLS